MKTLDLDQLTVSNDAVRNTEHYDKKSLKGVLVL